MADPSLCPPLTRPSLLAAHTLIRPHIHLTPHLTSTFLSSLASTPLPPSALHPTPSTPTIRLHFKCENLQRIGAFKARGAFHALARLSLDPSWNRAEGVVTHSSGNHAQALALAAREMGVKATVVMPKVAPAAKVAATRGYGAEVVFSGSTGAEREAVVAEVVREKGGRVVVPYDREFFFLVSSVFCFGLRLDGERMAWMAWHPPFPFLQATPPNQTKQTLTPLPPPPRPRHNPRPRHRRPRTTIPIRRLPSRPPPLGDPHPPRRRRPPLRHRPRLRRNPHPRLRLGTLLPRRRRRPPGVLLGIRRAHHVHVDADHRRRPAHVRRRHPVVHYLREKAGAGHICCE